MKNSTWLIVGAAALLTVVGWSGVGQKRQAWEYKGFSLLIQGTTPILYEVGKPVPGKADVGAKAAELGEQGWELVCVTQVSESVTAYWFKRPK